MCSFFINKKSKGGVPKSGTLFWDGKEIAMKKVVNELLNIVQPLLVGLALITLIVALVNGPGKTALDNMFSEAVSELESQMDDN